MARLLATDSQEFVDRHLKLTALSCIQHELDLPPDDCSVLAAFFAPLEPSVDDVRTMARLTARPRRGGGHPRQSRTRP